MVNNKTTEHNIQVNTKFCCINILKEHSWNFTTVVTCDNCYDYQPDIVWISLNHFSISMGSSYNQVWQYCANELFNLFHSSNMLLPSFSLRNWFKGDFIYITTFLNLKLSVIYFTNATVTSLKVEPKIVECLDEIK